MRTTGDFLDRYFLPVFRWFMLAICMALAWHYLTLWWHWEIRLPSWGLIPSRQETIIARLGLFKAVAALTFGAALFDLLKVPTKVRRCSIILFATAAASGIAPYVIERFLLT